MFEMDEFFFCTDLNREKMKKMKKIEKKNKSLECLFLPKLRLRFMLLTKKNKNKKENELNLSHFSALLIIFNY